MQKANGILLLTMTVLLMTIKASTSSYIGCYSCKFSSPDVSAVGVCSNPAAHSDNVTICVGLGCLQLVAVCVGTDEVCGASKGIKVERSCTNETDDKDDCKTLEHKPGPHLSSPCICRTEKCNVGPPPAPKSVCSLVKSVSSLVLVTMVCSTYFVSSMINIYPAFKVIE